MSFNGQQMKLTKSEQWVITAAAIISPGYPYPWIKPHIKRVARRLRDRGYLRRRRFFENIRLTAKGIAAFKNIR
jgi:hypothetical protein